MEVARAFQWVSGVPIGLRCASGDLRGFSEGFQGYFKGYLELSGAFQEFSVTLQGVSRRQREFQRNFKGSLGSSGGFRAVSEDPKEFHGVT